MADSSDVRGIVLAGGDSTRFGDREKALATYEERPLVAHVADALAAATGGPPLLAVATVEKGARLSDAVAPDVEPVVDDPDRSGPLAGLVGATGATDATWLLLCGCDMPLVSREAFERLVSAADEGVDAVVPVVEGHDQPLHACYRRAAVRRVAPTLPAIAGPRALLDRLGSVRRLDAGDADAPLARAVTNVNTQADLAALRDGTDQ